MLVATIASYVTIEMVWAGIKKASKVGGLFVAGCLRIVYGITFLNPCPFLCDKK